MREFMDRTCRFVFPGTSRDPRVNPFVDSTARHLRSERMLMCVVETDHLLKKRVLVAAGVVEEDEGTRKKRKRPRLNEKTCV